MDSDKSPSLKALTAWCAVGLAKCLEKIGVHSWNDAASMMSFFAGFAAFVYSILIIVGWFRNQKKGGRK